MTADLARYAELKRAGAPPAEAYRAARADGLDKPTCIRMLREVFGLSFVEAKEVTVVATGEAGSLDAHQADLADALEEP